MEPIPGPRGLPFLGNVLEALEALNAEVSLDPIERLADTYGEIFQMKMGSKHTIFVASADLAAELVDERRFVKEPPAALRTVDQARGLFAARGDEPDWGQAHRILIPAMGPLKVEEMFEDMRDIANQLILKWARMGPANRIFVTDDFTRLTLDAIALCAMNYRFNSFYQDEMHPFVEDMLYVLRENGGRATRPSFVTKMKYSTNRKYFECMNRMNQVCQEIIDERKAHPTDKADLVNAMIYGKDPKTGERMRDELVIAQMKNFLIAGHETTSGLLSFTMYLLLKNSATYLKAQKEVDDVVGREPIQPHHLKDLKYLQACLRESLRLHPTAPALFKKVNPEIPEQSLVLGGKYTITKSDNIMIMLTKVQRDPKVYGPDASEFRPERMLDEKFNELPPGAWRPFGNGSRACIGRPFAMQEATLVTAMILQNFDLRLDDPSYNLQRKQALTLKPKDLYIRASLRKGMGATLLDHQLHATKTSLNGPMLNGGSRHDAGTVKPMAIYFGSNSGTCQAFAQRLAADASTKGFKAVVGDLDSAVDKLPPDVPVILITSSYEGQPPDNAAQFIEWLQCQKPESMKDINFAVFGCGHKDWTKTFHRIPKLTEHYMNEWGAHCLAPIGLTDASRGNMYGDFEDWLDDKLWPSLASSKEGLPAQLVESAVEIEISTNARASSLRYDVNLATVKDNKCLTAPGEPEKWHMEIQLPSDSAYECGDYLAVLPLNSHQSVQRIMAHFKLPWDAVITLKTEGPSTIPTNTPLSVYDLLRSYVELSQPATKKNIKTCAEFTPTTETQVDLHTLAEDPQRFEAEILAKRTSVLDILSRHPDVELPFAEFLALLPPLRVRQYSISSSPISDPTRCTITYGVIHHDHSHADPDVAFHGVCGTYLSSLRAGDSVQVAVKPTAKKLFRLPADMEQTPMLMFAAGTGVAPFRGFAQQRAEMLQANPARKLAPAVLFLGCRNAKRDRLYADEMDAWTTAGVLDVVYAFSRPDDDPPQQNGATSATPSSVGSSKYVSDSMKSAEGKQLIKSLWRQQARVYVCGSRGFEQSVGQAGREIVLEHVREKLKAGGKLDWVPPSSLGTLPDAAEALKNGEGSSRLEDRVDEWFRETVAERVASDVFD